jgi:hypothetical protein
MRAWTEERLTHRRQCKMLSSKKLTCKGTLRPVFICLRPWTPYHSWVEIINITECTSSLLILTNTCSEAHLKVKLFKWRHFFSVWIVNLSMAWINVREPKCNAPVPFIAKIIFNRAFLYKILNGLVGGSMKIIINTIIKNVLAISQIS